MLSPIPPHPITVSITCGHAWISVVVPAALLGPRVLHGELTLGSGCGVTAADGDGFRLEHSLMGCGTTLEVRSWGPLNVLHYRPIAMGPVARAGPFSLPVDCYYPRTGSVSSGAIRPTWVPFGSTVAHRRPLRFALDAYDSTWASRLLQPLYPMGELMNIEASVSAGPVLPMRVFVDECEAAPGVGMQPSSRVIDNGCLLDGQLSRSRFLPQRGDRSLRFQLDTFLFPNTSSGQIHLHCHLRAVAEGAGSTMGKACSYDPISHSWHSLDGTDCSCCGSPSGCRVRARRFTRSRGEMDPGSHGGTHCGARTGTRVSVSCPMGLGVAGGGTLPSPSPHCCPHRPGSPHPWHHIGHGGHELRPRRRGHDRVLLLHAAALG
uniref:Zona pellucida sperm-binding protein 3 n=1 Tax=Amazona collaria TaxID=241587 RepID=A0A8B9G701_9PSIT